MTDFALRRTVMVDTQVRPNDVTKYPVIAAMLSVPREAFVPAAAREAAYVGENVVLAPGRVTIEPRSLGKLLDALDLGPGHRVLVIGAGYGYSAALAARLAGHVVAVEADAGLAAEAAARLAAQGVANAEVVAGDLAAGAPGKGPFERVLIEGAIERLPEAVRAQVAEGGRIGAIFKEQALGVARVGHVNDGQVSWRFAFNATAPVLPGFAAERAFRL